MVSSLTMKAVLVLLLTVAIAEDTSSTVVAATTTTTTKAAETPAPLPTSGSTTPGPCTTLASTTPVATTVTTTPVVTTTVTTTPPPATTTPGPCAIMDRKLDPTSTTTPVSTTFTTTPSPTTTSTRGPCDPVPAGPFGGLLSKKKDKIIAGSVAGGVAVAGAAAGAAAWIVHDMQNQQGAFAPAPGATGFREASAPSANTTVTTILPVDQPIPVGFRSVAPAPGAPLPPAGFKVAVQENGTAAGGASAAGGAATNVRVLDNKDGAAAGAGALGAAAGTSNPTAGAAAGALGLSQTPGAAAGATAGALGQTPGALGQTPGEPQKSSGAWREGAAAAGVVLLLCAVCFCLAIAASLCMRKGKSTRKYGELDRQLKLDDEVEEGLLTAGAPPQDYHGPVEGLAREYPVGSAAGGMVLPLYPMLPPSVPQPVSTYITRPAPAFVSRLGAIPSAQVVQMTPVAVAGMAAAPSGLATARELIG